MFSDSIAFKFLNLKATGSPIEPTQQNLRYTESSWNMRTPKFYAAKLASLKLHSMMLLLIFLALASLPPVGMAQEPKDGDDNPNSLNEQTIYVPYEKLRETFERDGRGVFLPYDKFQQLWKQARQNQPKKPDLKAPLGLSLIHI